MPDRKANLNTIRTSTGSDTMSASGWTYAGSCLVNSSYQNSEVVDVVARVAWPLAASYDVIIGVFAWCEETNSYDDKPSFELQIPKPLGGVEDTTVHRFRVMASEGFLVGFRGALYTGAPPCDVNTVIIVKATEVKDAA